jgi:hypothetical protein
VNGVPDCVDDVADREGEMDQAAKVAMRKLSAVGVRGGFGDGMGRESWDRARAAEPDATNAQKVRRSLTNT